MNIEEQKEGDGWHAKALVTIASGGMWPLHDDNPQIGTYKARYGDLASDPWYPVRILRDPMTGFVIAEYADPDFGLSVEKSLSAIKRLWACCARNPIPGDLYAAALLDSGVLDEKRAAKPARKAEEAKGERPLHGVGHNSAGADDHTYCQTGLADLRADLANIKAQHSTVRDQGAADYLSIIQDKAKDLKAKSEACRIAEKKPHDEKANAVQAKWKPLVDGADDVVKQLGKLLTDFKLWLRNEAIREQQRQREIKETELRAKAEALAKEQADARARLAAEAGATSAEVQAAATPDAIKVSLPEAEPVPMPQVGGLVGRPATGLTPVWHAEIENYDAALMALKDHPEVKALIERLANAGARSKAKLPIAGVKYVQTYRG